MPYNSNSQVTQNMTFSRLGYNDNPLSDQQYVMFHGTSKENAFSIIQSGFRQSPDGMLGRGVYLSGDKNKAAKYPLGLPANEKVIFKVIANVGKVIRIDRQGHPCQKTWHDRGVDTAWVPPDCGMVLSGQEEDCVWDVNRIHIIDVFSGMFISVFCNP